MSRKAYGFTIVELLIVVVVIAILAAISIMTYTGIQQRARDAQAISDLAALEKAITMARINQDRALVYITDSGCTHCGDQARYELTLDRIGQAAGVDLAHLKDGDPWGNRYWIDENELDGGVCSDRRDLIRTNPYRNSVGRIFIPFYSCGN